MCIHLWGRQTLPLHTKLYTLNDDDDRRLSSRQSEAPRDLTLGPGTIFFAESHGEKGLLGETKVSFVATDAHPASALRGISHDVDFSPYGRRTSFRDDTMTITMTETAVFVFSGAKSQKLTAKSQEQTPKPPYTRTCAPQTAARRGQSE